MEKFQWSLLKTLEFVNSRRPDLEIRANFLNQLQVYTKRSKTLIAEDHDENLTDNAEESNNNQAQQKKGNVRKTERTEEFTDYINNLKMYEQLKERSPETFTTILKTVDEKAQVEQTISNTFLNSQNNDNLEGSVG